MGRHPDHGCARRDEVVGPGEGPRVRRQAGRSAKPESLKAPVEAPFVPLRNVFSRDGKLLAVGGVDTRAMLWDVDPAVWRRRACATAGRNLTREEWKLYLSPGKEYRATCSEWSTS